METALWIGVGVVVGALTVLAFVLFYFLREMKNW